MNFREFKFLDGTAINLPEQVKPAIIFNLSDIYIKDKEGNITIHEEKEQVLQDFRNKSYLVLACNVYDVTRNFSLQEYSEKLKKITAAFRDGNPIHQIESFFRSDKIFPYTYKSMDDIDGQSCLYRFEHGLFTNGVMVDWNRSFAIEKEFDSIPSKTWDELIND